MVSNPAPADSVPSSVEAAHGAKGLLEDEGIEALVTNEHFIAISSFPTTAVGGVGT